MSVRTRVFLWGLSNGIMALTIGALFWFGLGLGPYADRVEWIVDAFVTLVVYGSCGALIWGAIRQRRRSGFQRTDLKSSDPDQRSKNRKIVLNFVGVVVVQAILVVVAVVCCFKLGAQELLWPFIALIVSLHFVPLGRIFRVTPYYFVGIVGSIVSILSLAPIFAEYRVMYLGVSMGIVMLGSAAFLIWKADEIAKKSLGKAHGDESSSVN